MKEWIAGAAGAVSCVVIIVNCTCWWFCVVFRCSCCCCRNCCCRCWTELLQVYFPPWAGARDRKRVPGTSHGTRKRSNSAPKIWVWIPMDGWTGGWGRPESWQGRKKQKPLKLNKGWHFAGRGRWSSHHVLFLSLQCFSQSERNGNDFSQHLLISLRSRFVNTVWEFHFSHLASKFCSLCPAVGKAHNKTDGMTDFPPVF